MSSFSQINHIPVYMISVAKDVVKSAVNYSSTVRDCTGKITKMDVHPRRGGTFADVFKGKWVNPLDEGSPPFVAIKCMRSLNDSENEKLKKAKVSHSIYFNLMIHVSTCSSRIFLGKS